jgi:cysteine desulfurase
MSVYADYNAGAPLRPEARAAMLAALDAGGNPSSVYSAGRRARRAIEDAREQLAAAIGARAENVVFASGATEAIHLVIDSAMATPGAALIVAACEHDAVFEHARRHAPPIAGLTPDGLVDFDALEALLAIQSGPKLLAVQLANNETGVIQPVARVAALARQHGAMLLVDAAQALGRMDVNLQALDATYLVVSSHKIGGPQGAGALVLAPGAPFLTTRAGGGQERGRRPGTENAPAIAGFGAAAARAVSDLSEESQRLARLRDRFEAALPADATVFGAAAPRLANTSNFALPGLSAETAVIAMDIEGVCVSSGAACSSGKVRASRVLGAMGAAFDLARCALRVSFGWASGDDDVGAVLAALSTVRARRPALAGAA